MRELIQHLDAWINCWHGQLTFHLMQLFCGHGALQGYLYSMGIKRDPMYPLLQRNGRCRVHIVGMWCLGTATEIYDRRTGYEKHGISYPLQGNLGLPDAAKPWMRRRFVSNLMKLKMERKWRIVNYSNNDEEPSMNNSAR